MEGRHGVGLRPIIPVLAPDDDLVRALQEDGRLLASMITRVPTLPVLSVLVGESDATVIDLRSTRLSDLELYQLLARHETSQIVVFDSPSGVRHLRPTSRVWVVGASTTPVELARAVNSARFAGWHRRMCNLVRKHEGLPYTTRLALLRAVPNSLEPRVTLATIAQDIGVSRSYLTRLLSQSSLNVSEITDRWLAVRAAWMRKNDGRTWEAASWKLGYQTMSGLSDSMYRATSMRLREAARYSPDYWVEWFEEELRRALADTGQAA